MVVDLISGPDWERSVLELVGRVADALPAKLVNVLGGFNPDLRSATSVARRIDGVALSTYNLDSTRTQTEPGDIVEIAILESGGVRTFMSRLSGTLREEGDVIFEVGLVLWARQLMELVAALSAHSGFLGSWALGVGATGLRGRKPYRATQGWRSTVATLESDTYKAAVVATYAQLVSAPGATTQRLIGRLLRALNADTAFQAAMSDDS